MRLPGTRPSGSSDTTPKNSALHDRKSALVKVLRDAHVTVRGAGGAGVVIEYPPPPDWSVPPPPTGSIGDPVGSGRPGPSGRPAGRSGRPGKYHQCIAVNAIHEGRCKRPVRHGDPDDLCTVHRGQVNRGKAVRTVRLGKLIEPPEHMTDAQIVSIGHGRGTRRIELDVARVDFKSLRTIEGRETLEAIAIATVATILQDPTTKDQDRLRAAAMVLPKHQLTAEELEQERDLDDEIFQLLDELAREAEELSDHHVIELLSPETKALVVAELASQGIEEAS
jgi:hypothetical protein